jgi:predicted enzyme related to lactoylglutathione lyase
MGNPITWFEINGPEPEQTAKFYSEVFGWHTETVPGNYILLDTHSGAGMNGGIGQTREGQPPHTVFYVENPDIQKLLDQAEQQGSKVIVPVTEIPDMVTFAQFTDPFGNLVGLVKGDGTVRVSEGSNPAVDWVEISLAEPKKAWDFYRNLFGWKIEGGEASGSGMVHASFDTGGPGARGGIGGTPDGQPHVSIYASVDDVQKYLERAESLGSKTLMKPMKVDEHTHIAVFVDPQGTTFGLYQYQP